MNSTPPRVAADYIRELTRPYTTRATIHRTTRDHDGRARAVREVHTVHHPSLINQLDEATTANSHRSDSDAARGIATSKPAAHLEAIDALNRINHQSRTLAGELDVNPIPPRLIDRLEAIAGALGTDNHRQVRSWWATARLLTQHDTPPIRPHGVPCPECWETDTLRIRLEDELASCHKCGALWDRTGNPDHGSLDVLGQHVRWCADHQVTKPRHLNILSTGEQVECADCAPFRDAYTEWRHARPTELDNQAVDVG